MGPPQVIHWRKAGRRGRQGVTENPAENLAKKLVHLFQVPLRKLQVRN